MRVRIHAVLHFAACLPDTRDSWLSHGLGRSCNSLSGLRLLERVPSTEMLRRGTNVQVVKYDEHLRLCFNNCSQDSRVYACLGSVGKHVGHIHAAPCAAVPGCVNGVHNGNVGHCNPWDLQHL